LRTHLKFVVFCLLAALALVWFVWNLDVGRVAGAMRRADWWLVALAVALVWLTYLIRAFRWRTLLRPLAPAASLRETFAATTVGFAAIFLVGRAVGELLRPAFLSLRDPEVRPGPAFVTIAVERLCDITAVVIFFAANLLVLRLPGVDEAAQMRLRWAALICLGAALVGFGGLIWFRRHAAAVTRWLDARFGRWPAPLARAGRTGASLLGHLAETLGVFTNARELLATVGWTAALWALITAANMLVLRAFGLTLGVSETVFVLGWSLVGSLLPTPGAGAGTYHAATAHGLVAYLGVGKGEADAATIVLHLVVFGAALVFGLYYFLRGGVSLASLRGAVESGERPGGAGGGARSPKLETTFDS
jgi:uncharacterized protein (TIRG00374 family)